jgi:hypothetical protein
MKQKLVLSLMMVVLTVGIASVPAFADSITLNLSDSVQFGHGGETLNFYATLLAPGSNSAAIYLNGDNFNLASPLFLDDSGFFANFPLFLNPGGSSTSLLFTVFIPGGTASGAYSGDFQILGGSDGFSQDAISNDATFLIDVPEPNALMLMLSLTGITLGLLYRYKLLAF